MKLAVALNERAEMKRRLHGYMMRATDNTVRVNDEEANDDPIEMIEKYGTTLQELEDLIFAINETNNRTIVANDLTLAQAIVRRDTMKLEYDFYNTLAETAKRNQRPENFRYHVFTNADGTKIQPVIHKLIDAKEMRRRADYAAKTMREWDIVIQETNWRTELLDMHMTAEDFE